MLAPACDIACVGVFAHRDIAVLCIVLVQLSVNYRKMIKALGRKSRPELPANVMSILSCHLIHVGIWHKIYKSDRNFSYYMAIKLRKKYFSLLSITASIHFIYKKTFTIYSFLISC